jgi:lipopolysaccharide/colanic/teichoic acid biosynthesis glycosyltransferase
MRRRPVQQAVKRFLDPAAAVVGLVVLSPAYAGIALAVLVDSGRPVIFVSPRAGAGGRAFGMLKFRTMIPDAIAVGREQSITEDPFGVVRGDPRITRVGRWLRRTGLDELPQLVNVARGQMSLVGPRADLVEQAAAYTDEERRRLTVRPGITGWAQVNGRDSVSWTERFALDLWYLDNWSLWLDAKILVRTVGEVFRPEPDPVEDALNIERAKKRASSP